ncbi:hypothetical protein [Flavisolibacter tropicus]|uniref:DUF4197 domain-containing protein n=1 Tax=Flavisolibacter tropicus TaxID=1492898 RepID=A0A172TWN3_9BACT|nr:hypothetical protein [Flavisolibacter tropicus]ANE51440.1 hypothetical protein SY85_13930 [Flavisolibacter tropicus]
MKRYFLFIILVTGLCSATYAQLPNVTAPATSSVANIGQMVTQLVGAIKPSSFTNAWSGEKANWMQKAQGAVSDASGLASSISSLAGFIKPGLFKKGFSAAGIADLAKNVTSLSGAAGLLKSFAGGLKPKAFNPEWKGQQSGWESALGMIQ